MEQNKVEPVYDLGLILFKDMVSNFFHELSFRGTQKNYSKESVWIASSFNKVTNLKRRYDCEWFSMKEFDKKT